MGEAFTVVAREHGVEELELAANGLRVLLMPDPGVPVVAVCIVYHVGSRNEAVGHTGATHLLEHLMFKGSRRFNAEAGSGVARVLERVGASFNATTWFDRTTYYETLPPEHLGLALAIEADRMRGALLRAEDLASELTVVQNELERGENDPFDLLLRDSFAIAFREHPYHHPTIGWRSDVEAATIERLRGFYDTFYYPDNATAVVVGAFDREEALRLIDASFGSLPRAPRPFPPVVTREPRQEGERRFVLRRAGEVGWVACSWRSPEATHPDIHPLAVAADVLAGGVTSRLYQRLVETGTCLDVQAVAWQLRDPGLFQVFASLNPPARHEEVEAVIREAVRELQAEPPSPEELERARVGVEAQAAYHRDAPAQVASALGEAISAGNWRAYFDYLERVRAVERGDVTRVAASYLVDDALTVGHFVPRNGESGAPSRQGPMRPRPCWWRSNFGAEVRDGKLPGGGRLLLLPRHSNCTVHVQGSLLAGHGMVEMADWTAASVMPDMLERGTSRFGRLELARALEDRGIELDVSGESFNPLEVYVSGRCLSRHLDVLCEVLFDMLRRPTFPEEELERVRQLRLGELAQSQEDTFLRAFEAFSRLVFPGGHPCCRRPAEQRRQGLLALTRADLERVHRELYGPASLVLAMVGDFDPERVAARIAELCDGWTGGRGVPVDPPRLGRADAPPAEAFEVMADKPNLDVVMGCPGGLRRRDPDFLASLLGNAVLGQSTLSSRLGRRLRDQEGLTYGVVSRFFGASLVDGPWAVTFSVAPGNLERATALAREEIESFVAEGPSDAELEDERAAMAGSYRVSLSTPSGVARELARLARHDLPFTELDTVPERILATPREAVAEAVRQHIRPRSLARAVAGEIVAKPPAGR
ncbi:MAG TPA: pitrilysin family protein [Thermoanaerobaculaceae bacterium]|nr:pitrilysin family protein [Thermoanaerobaculaceae bacterium]HRS15815.1 pitrilysin family protein [Thermoanaerobaculaceae bacterium]